VRVSSFVRVRRTCPRLLGAARATRSPKSRSVRPLLKLDDERVVCGLSASGPASTADGAMLPKHSWNNLLRATLSSNWDCDAVFPIFSTPQEAQRNDPPDEHSRRVVRHEGETPLPNSRARRYRRIGSCIVPPAGSDDGPHKEGPMRKLPWMLLAISCLATTTAFAQNAPRTEAPPHEPAHETKLITGCLTAGADATTFKLTNAVAVAPSVPPPAASNAPPPASEPRSVPTSGQQVEYELKAEARLDATSVSPVEMKKFVGRQVQVTTRPLEPVPAPAVPPAKAGEPRPEPEAVAKPEEKGIERLVVTSIKEVSASCK
jgi:hypothetical protein